MQRTERFDSADRIIKIGFWVNALLMIFKMAAAPRRPSILPRVAANAALI